MHSSGNLGVLTGSSSSSAAASAGLRRPLGTLGASLLYSASAEEKVVLDIGSCTLRAGFSTDARPLYTGSSTLPPITSLSDAHLRLLLTDQLRSVYRKHLLLDAKTRKVAVVEGAMMPARVRELVAHVLLENMRVPVVTFYPAAVAALMTCGRTAGLVVDCGFRQAAVVPVYDCREMTPYSGATAVAGEMLVENVRRLVLRFGSFAPFEGQGSSVPVDEAMLDDSVVEFVARKMLYASPVAMPESLGSGARELGVGVVDAELAEWFESSRTAQHRSTRLTIDTASRGRGTLTFPSWIRERAAEVLLSGDGPQDLRGVVDVLVQTLARCPVDTRRALVQGILVVGGPADMPGLRLRLLHDVVARLRGNARWRGLANDAALAEQHVGGAVFAAAERPWVGVALAVSSRIGGVDVKHDSMV
ncbi:hypothetical protein LPJ53_000861 [Coemansia erecta]|uniref:Actin-like ATPase domain-containing protein n=1 Tax=Coemansia erecta TaxID=147472 RepID=A0A9W7Y7P6_9FUNG|nr:hypothetical protein LPJ53_000861 [Coemansia erecta]